jgi:hypothetical protein
MRDTGTRRKSRYCTRVELWLTCCPDGQSIWLADSHPYGNTLNWHCQAQDHKTLHAVARRLR